MKRLICGWGINDADKPLSRYNSATGKRDTCPIYVDWINIIRRGFSSYEKDRHPTYKEVTVSEQFRRYSDFSDWVLTVQPNPNWVMCDLDKDILSINGSKIYSPETCVYIHSNVNTFISSSAATRGNYLLGVYWEDTTSKYRACCQNPFTGKNEKLGRFSTELEAHLAWQTKKHEHALRLAEEQQDPRVAKALRERYAPDKDWTNK